MQFIDFARAYGLLIKDLYPSERVRRCGTISHPKKKNGAYFWDGDRGWVFDWSGEAEVKWFYTDKPWTEAEKQAWKRKQQANWEQQERKYAMAAKKAEAILNTATPKTHDYLYRKGFKEQEGLVLPDGALAIPMRNVRTNLIQGLQTIYWDGNNWQKKMLPGMRAKYAVFWIGSKNAPEVILCEGYATGLSIAQAVRMSGLNMAVVVCFSDSNMVTVASQISGKKYIYADNDVSHAGENAAKKATLPYCMSEVEGNDANDDHVQFGLMYVVKKIMDVRLAEVVEA